MKLRAPRQLNITLSDEEQAVLSEVWEATGNKPQALTHSLLMALKRQWEQEGQIVMPLRLSGTNETLRARGEIEVSKPGVR